MNAHAKPLRLLSVALIVATLGIASGSAAALNRHPIDIMDQPARQSEHARSALLNAIHHAGKRLVAVGERGVILLSDDNGQSWRQAKSVPTSVTLTAVHFPSDRTGWAVGHSGVVLETSDGGETWIRQLEGKKAADIELAAADAAVRGGAAPSQRQLDAKNLVKDGADKPFLGVHFSDELHGFVVGAYGLAFSTSDGGKNWSSMMGQIENPRARHLYSIYSADNAFLIAGEQGTLLRSSDRRMQFTAIPFTYSGSLFGAVVADNNSILVFGLRGNAFHSLDGGKIWSKIDVGLPVTLTAGIKLRDGRLAVVDETGRVLISQDYGSTFRGLSIAKMNAATGLIEASDGALVVSTYRGAVRIAPDIVRAESPK